MITLAASPLGNPADASARFVSLLASSDVIAAEDTRRVRRLAKDLGVQLTADLISYFDANERSRAAEIVDRALQGEHVLVLTDAGMPVISDPGYRVVQAAIAAGVSITCAPGPSAVTTALALSGLPSDRFTFEGFLPRKSGERAALLHELRAEPRTMVFFEAPHRLAASLASMRDVFGPDRSAAICRELTKTYEEVIRGPLSELAVRVESGLRGEITIVVAGSSAEERRVSAGLETAEDWSTRVADLVATGFDRRSAITHVAKEAGISRRLVYAAVIDAKAAKVQP
jgi:16S rRNA (cytidine1402-2'-O)-methyltransferase